jgi:hypothetical protein
VKVLATCRRGQPAVERADLIDLFHQKKNRRDSRNECSYLGIRLAKTYRSRSHVALQPSSSSTAIYHAIVAILAVPFLRPITSIPSVNGALMRFTAIPSPHTIGDEKIELFPGRGETQDATFVWLPKRRAPASGDFFIWVFPSARNPRKVLRYAPDWAAALRRMGSIGGVSRGARGGVGGFRAKVVSRSD